MMRIAWIALVLAVAPAPAQKVDAQTAKGFDLRNFQTYSWLPGRSLTRQGLIENHPDIDPLIRKAVNARLAEKGLRQVPEGGDLQAAYITVQTVIPSFNWTSTGSYWGDWALGPSLFATRINKEGTLALNLIDSRTGKSAWSAIASGATKSGSRMESLIDRAVRKMIDKMPR